jgi:hypothetical protein
MEEKKKNTGEEKKSNPDPNNPLAGFDFSKLLENEGVMEFLKHLLSGGGAMAGNYFLWIKPLQDKCEAMNKKIDTQENRIRELEYSQDKLIDELNREKKSEADNNLKGTSEDYFTTRKTKPQGGNYRYRNVRM